MSREQQKQIDLYDKLIKSFSENEIQDLSFKLGVSYEDLPGETRRDKARELVQYLSRRDRLHELVTIIQTNSTDIALIYPSTKIAMRWYSPLIVVTLITLFLSLLWMWSEPGFEPIIAIVIALGTLVASVFYENSGKRLPAKKELLISTLFFFAVLLIGYVFYYLSSNTINQPPVIHSLNVANQVAIPNEQITVTVRASDPDGDPLNFYWSSMYGSVPGGSQSPNIIYVAPPSVGGGIDIISVTVIDSEGNKIEKRITISIHPSK